MSSHRPRRYFAVAVRVASVVAAASSASAAIVAAQAELVLDEPKK